MKTIKIISCFLGATSLIFGLLKFVNPFKEWVTIQVEQSGLPAMALPLVITGEIITGLLFLLPFIAKTFFRHRLLLIIIASITWIMMMMAAVYVHLQPEVPAEVLPLKIKEPYIPLLFVLMAVINLFLMRKLYPVLKPGAIGPEQ